MGKSVLYPLGTTDSCRYAAGFLNQSGWRLLDHPAPEVTHLLLDIPSFRSSEQVEAVRNTLSMLPGNVTVIGGNLDEKLPEQCHCLDLLKDETYLARNAAITADCALRVAGKALKTTFPETPTLILGWGRIAKCLALRLSALGCKVTVAARKEQDLAMIAALGCEAVEISLLPRSLSGKRLLLNTIPAPMLDSRHLASYSSCVKIDLASRNGLDADDVIWARGLPGIYAPESSGRCIADNILRLQKEECL